MPDSFSCAESEVGSNLEAYSLVRNMSRIAGSAIAQGPNVGRIDQWSKWKPTEERTLWLLLSGATNPPEGIEISKRRPRDAPGDKNGAFLHGISHDLLNMQKMIVPNLYNTVQDLYLRKDKALEHITKCFKTCKDKEIHPMLYYTGHGETGTGNWCFADGTVSIKEIYDLVPGDCFYPLIFSDACYSGHWANFCLRKGIESFHCLAACPDYSSAIDTEGVLIAHNSTS